MLLPEKKEREYRFRLALRMGLPIFGLILVLVFTTLINNYENLTASFYVESALLLLVSVYFILYLIYKGFDVTITDEVSKTFTREYLYTYLKNQIQKHNHYTLILVSIDNLTDINSQYGIKNGDKILYRVSHFVGEYLQQEGFDNFPLGRVKGGDFLIGLEGDAQEHKVVLELLLLKSDELKFENIEVKISAAITDTTFSKDIDHLVDNLFEQQEIYRYKNEDSVEEIDPNELELLVIEALEKRSLSIASQKVYDSKDRVAFLELFIRIKTKNGRYIHQKKYKKVINKLGLTLDFDLMLIESMLKRSQEFDNNKVAIPVNTSSLRNPDFFTKVQQLLQQERLLASRLIFCFSENEYYYKTEKFNAILHSYKELGINFAVDHLGVLHSTFLYLRDLDIDIVRFDSSYTKEDHFKRSIDVIKGLSYIAHARGIKTWVKMIETESQFLLTKELEVDFIQGKYLSQMEEIS